VTACTARCMGSPDVPDGSASCSCALAFSAKRQNRKDLRYIRGSAAIAVFCSEADDKPHWIEAGRCYERLALQIAALDLRTAFINQPVEVPALRHQFAGFLGIVIGGRTSSSGSVAAPRCRDRCGGQWSTCLCEHGRRCAACAAGEGGLHRLFSKGVLMAQQVDARFVRHFLNVCTRP